MRHGSNPGTVVLDGQRVPIRVPRVRSEQAEIPLRSYQGLHGSGEVDDALLRRVLYGISCRNYEAAARAIPGAIGLSSSSVSRGFVTASAAQLKEFLERDLSKERYVALFLDGKSFADATLVIALGVTVDGTKRFLGFVETDTENDKVLAPFLRSLIERGLDLAHGLLVVIDGGKGLRSSVRQVFQKKALVQRCQWHKRENVVSYLAKRDKPAWRRKLQAAYAHPTYRDAKRALERLYRELRVVNESAAASLAEGLEETLTLHRLNLFPELGLSFKTTNLLESVMAGVEAKTWRVTRWRTSDQKQRWCASALQAMEQHFRRVKNYRHLHLLKQALQPNLTAMNSTAA
jgi:transposase-like protein